MRPQFDGFTFNRVGTTGCEIRDPDGLVIGWTVDEAWAAVITKLLNNAPSIAADAEVALPNAACGCGRITAANKET